MIITLEGGQEINTDKLNDLDALVYEKLRLDLEFWAKYDLSFYTVLMFNDENRKTTAAYNLKKDNLLTIITWFKEELEKQTKGSFTLQIVSTEKEGGNNYGEFPTEY